MTKDELEEETTPDGTSLDSRLRPAALRLCRAMLLEGSKTEGVKAIFTAAVWLPVTALTTTASPEYDAGGETEAVTVPVESVVPWF
jgi:hypothetical protein